MKILLVNSTLPTKDIDAISPNIGLGYLAANLIKEGYEVEIFDTLKKNASEKKLNERLKKLDYKIVGFQLFTFNMNRVREKLKLIKSIDKNIITVVGGPHPSADPIETLQYLKEADFAIKSEGEITLTKLVKAINNGFSFKDIPNLVFREDDRIIENNTEVIANLDSIPSPAWNLINPNHYPIAPIGAFIKAIPISVLFPTRGCPYRCVYCAAHTINGRKVRKESHNKILTDIKNLYFNYNVRELHIISDNFTYDKEFVKEFCKRLITENLKIYIAFPNGVRLDTLDKELLILLQEAGCYSITLGIESGSQRILNHMRRDQTIDIIKEKIDLIKKTTKMDVIGNFIIGYPKEEKKDIIKTIKSARMLNLDRAYFASFVPLPGTEIYKELKNKLNNINYELFQVHKFGSINDKISKFTLTRLRLTAYITFYLRPKKLWNLLKRIKSSEQLRYIIIKISKLFIF